MFEGKRAVLEKQNSESRAAAEKQAATMGNLSVSIIRQASEDGKLYGSVAVRDIATALEEAGHTIERRFIDMTSAIKSLGVYEATIHLHPEVSVPVKVQVARNAEGLLGKELAAKETETDDKQAYFDDAQDDSSEEGEDAA